MGDALPLDLTAPARPPAKMTASDVVDAVIRHYGCSRAENATGAPPEWAVLDELSMVGPSYGSRIDLFLVRAWSGKPKGHERHAIEVKVDRADLRSELARPWKREPFAKLAHRFYLATPEHLCNGIDLPEDIGLLEVTDRGVRVARRAPRTDPEPIPEALFVEVFRRASRAERRVAVPEADDLAARCAAAELAARRAQAAEVRAREAARVERDRASALMSTFAVLAPAVPCICGEVIARVRRKGQRLGWEHAAPVSGCSWPAPDLNRLLDSIDPDPPAALAAIGQEAKP